MLIRIQTALSNHTLNACISIPYTTNTVAPILLTIRISDALVRVNDNNMISVATIPNASIQSINL